VDRGFSGEGVLTAEVSLPSIRYGNEKRESWDFFDRFRERIEALPGAQAVSISNLVPLAGSKWEQGIFPEGTPVTVENSTSVLFNIMSLDHFEVLGIDLVQGREFNELDREGAALVAIVDETMAEAFWPGENPIGRRVTFESETIDEEEVRIYREVVGVTRNIRHYELQSASRVQIYVPMAQSRNAWSSTMMILVKTAGPPLEMTDLVRRELRGLDPEVPLADVRTMENIVDGALSSTRIIGVLLGAFSSMAILLSGIGLFGVVSFSAAQRMREIGIRVALGAESRDVLKLVAAQGMEITGLGVLIGVAGAALLSGLMSPLLFEVAPLDPLVYGSVTAFLCFVSALASYLPARRATAADPSAVLRED
jgi:putative ABC transport system permease protein